jgi:hypothetical protein
MAGGLMQLVSQGQANIILNGNPSKTFFKATYAKYTNFGMQHFRVDYEGSKTLQLTSESTFTFKIPRYGDLLMDTFVSVDLPNIWSPIAPPVYNEMSNDYSDWEAYQFKWIKNIGTIMIKNISITCGNQTLQEYSGNYLYSMVERDFSDTKKNLYYKMTGNVIELNDPANYGSNNGNYPNAFYNTSSLGPAPSIVGRTLLIPLGAWFTLKPQQSFPLVALQYNELRVNITFRPINELFLIRDVYDTINNYPYVAPNFNLNYMQMYYFLQPPPEEIITPDSYVDMRSVWDPNIYLSCTYCFLSNDESKVFASNEQKYLINQINEYSFYNVTGSNKVELNTTGMVKDYLFYFQRSDANLTNQWTNLSNWKYEGVDPVILVPGPLTGDFVYTDMSGNIHAIGPGINPNNTLTGLDITPTYDGSFQQNILLQFGVLFDGEYRENLQTSGVYNYVEKYSRSCGDGPNGLYCYNFCMNTSPFDMQPSGAINMSRFNKIEFEFTTINPPLDPLAQSLVICDPQTGEIIGINKPTWRIYQYNYDLYVFEERVNMVVFVGGNAGLLYAT